MLPPNIKLVYEENDPWGIAQLIAYEQVRQMEGTSSEVKVPKGKERK